MLFSRPAVSGRAIPKDLPPRSSVYDYFDLWTYDGTWNESTRAL